MSRIFPEPNLKGGWKCPLCHTAEVKPIILVPIPGTEEGNNVQARQIHNDCAKIIAIEFMDANRPRIEKEGAK